MSNNPREPAAPRATGKSSRAGAATGARADYTPLFDADPWQPPGSTAAARHAALWELACALREPTQSASRRLDRELAHPRLAAGYSYLGQLVAHDVSHHDPQALLRPGSTPENTRRRKLELETLYGAGPHQDRELYEPSDPACLRVEKRRSPIDGSVYHDVARDAEGRALVADVRQDQNVIVAQVHVAFARAHNAIVAALRRVEPDAEPFALHERARRVLVDAYHHVLVRHWMPHVLHPDVMRRIGARLDAHDRGRAASPLFGDGPAFVSAEFAFAAFRFAHSMVREQYRMRPEGYLYDMTPATEEAGWQERAGPHLVLSRPLPAPFAVDWRAFLDNDRAEPNRSRRIGPRVTWSLGNLPRTVREPRERALLPYMTLHSGCALPTPLVSGPSAARALGLPVIEGAHEPLWCYVLCEAQSQCRGEHLGLLGSTIVGETLAGLLLAKADAAITRRADFVPPLGAHEGKFELWDLLTLGDRDADWIAERLGATASASA